ncbi:uncharacterized protein [Bemisia tabaci]|uniref:uncharacterized protein isoform X4 n=1 Tax=Bemisia tabaci TaxID=7038 RepID=UPI003B2845EF
MIAVKILIVSGLLIMGPELCLNIRPTHGGVTTRSDSDSDPENPENKVKKHSEGKLGAVPSDLGHSSSVSSAYSTGLTPSSSMGSTTSTGSEDTSWDFGKRGKPVGKSMRTNRKSKEWWERSRSSSLSSDSSSLDLPTKEDLAAFKEERPSSPKSPDRISDVETSSTEPAKKRPVGKSVRTRNSKEYWDKASMSSLSSDSSPFSSFRSEPSSFSDFSSVPSSPRESSEPSSPKKKEELSAEAKCNLKCLNKEGWVDGGEEYENAQLPVKDGYLVEEDGVPTCKCKFNSQFMFFLNGKGVNTKAYKELAEKDPVSAREWLEKLGVKVNLLHTKRQMSRSPPVKRRICRQRSRRNWRRKNPKRNRHYDRRINRNHHRKINRNHHRKMDRNQRTGNRITAPTCVEWSSRSSS